MKLVITLLAVGFLSACASKPPAPAKTETPATAAVEKASVETKTTEKKTKKSVSKKMTESKGEKSAVGTAEVNCKSGTEERKLAIQVKGSGCELMYTKGGEAKAIASQMNGSEKCEEVMTSVKEKLVAANYTCE